MRKIFKMTSIIFTASLVLCLALPALAQENANTAAENTNAAAEEKPVEVTILPDSPWYSLKLLGEKIQETFTLRTEAKLQLMEKLGEKRAVEAQKLIEKGKPELAQKILDKYNQRLEKIKKLIEEKGNRLENKLEKWEQKTKARFEHRNEVLQRVLEKAPEAAKPGLQRALENNQKSLENLDKVIKQKIENRERLNQRLRERLQNMNANVNAVNVNTNAATQ